MGEVLKLFTGRARRGVKLPKPRACRECGDPIETARLQSVPNARRCFDCQQANEARELRILATAREPDVVIIRR